MPAPKERVYRIGLIADLHCGSRYAITPDGYRPLDAGPSGEFSRYMTQCFAHFVAACPHLDALVINGDCLEGEHPTMRSAPDAIDTSPLRQVDIAVEVLTPLRKKTNALWLVRGTGFHEGKWCDALESLGHELKAETWSKRRYSGEVLDGELGGVKFNIAHAQTSGAIYPGTLMNRTIWMANIAERTAKSIDADIIVRSHTHSTGRLDTQGKTILSTRAWKLVNPHAISRMEYYRAVALLDLGGHVVTIGPDGVAWKDYPYAPYKANHRKLA